MVVGVQDFNLDQFKVEIGNRTIRFLKSGKYQLKRPLVINEPNVTLIGIGEVTLVKAVGADGVYVNEEGRGFRMTNIKIVDSDGDNDGFCLVVKANNTLIEHCYFDRRKCNDAKFTVYYPGPDHQGPELPTALQIYFNVNGHQLHTGNVFLSLIHI